MVDENYHTALFYIPLVLLAFEFKCITEIIDIGIYMPKRPTMPFKLNLMSAIISILGYVFLVPRYQLDGLIAIVSLWFSTHYGLL